MTLTARFADDPHNALWHIVDVAADQEVVVGLIILATDDPAFALSTWSAAITSMEEPG